MALARVTEEDPFNGMPEAEEFGAAGGDLHLYYEDVYSLPGPERIEWARRAEAAALAVRMRASPTPTAGALTLRRGARCWPTRAGLWAAIAPAMRACRLRRWLWMRMGRCSATAGGRARGSFAHLEIPEAVGTRSSAANPAAAGGAARAYAAGSDCFFAGGGALADRVASSRRRSAMRSGAGHRFWPASWARPLPLRPSRLWTTT